MSCPLHPSYELKYSVFNNQIKDHLPTFEEWKDWFENQSRDFKLVCTLSSYDWEYVAYAYKKAQKKGLTSYTEYQYKFLYGEDKPIKKDKFVLRVRDEYF